jgi:hypothetical protein
MVPPISLRTYHEFRVVNLLKVFAIDVLKSKTH